MSVPGKNSYNAGILCSNWQEDRAGARLALVKPAMYAAAPFATSSQADAMVDHGPANTAGPAPAPLDRLDGPLVMAHGVNITERTPPGDHYLTVNQSFFKRLPEKLVLQGPGSVPGNVGRVELMRKKALLRAAGIDAWDIDAVTHKNTLLSMPMSSEPLRGASLAGIRGDQAGNKHWASVSAMSTSHVATTASVSKGVHDEKTHFGRDGRFTKEFAGSRADYQSLLTAKAL